MAKNDYSYHEAANIFPLDEANIDGLAADIKQNGLLTPIELMGGAIIDGRRRWLACRRANVEPAFHDVNPSDPVAHVLSLNLHRRHLTPAQLSMVGARAKGWYEAEAKKRQKEAGVRGNKTRAGKEAPVQANLPEPALNAGQA